MVKVNLHQGVLRQRNWTLNTRLNFLTSGNQCQQQGIAKTYFKILHILNGLEWRKQPRCLCVLTLNYLCKFI